MFTALALPLTQPRYPTLALPLTQHRYSTLGLPLTQPRYSTLALPLTQSRYSTLALPLNQPRYSTPDVRTRTNSPLVHRVPVSLDRPGLAFICNINIIKLLPSVQILKMICEIHADQKEVLNDKDDFAYLDLPWFFSCVSMVPS